jgi:ABC-type sugar transport systems, ATPase components
MSGLQLTNVKKSFGAVEVIKGVDLEIADKEFVVFVGPSGCGKSTLLRMIAGLEQITSGDLYIGDSRMNDVDPSRRGIAMVFQTYALYPHMSVRENMGFALKFAGAHKAEIEARVQERRVFWNSGRCWTAALASFPAANANASPSAGPS